MSTIPEPEPARPWRLEDGPQPEVWTWPTGDRPALEVWSAGKWRYAPVMARQNWADGSVYYQVSVDLRGDTTVFARMYRWPQPGLRKAHDSGSKPSRSADEARRRAMPQARPREAHGAAGAFREAVTAVPGLAARPGTSRRSYGSFVPRRERGRDSPQ